MLGWLLQSRLRFARTS